jgi:hypothetical protein
MKRIFYFILIFSMAPLSIWGQSAEEETIRLKQSVEIGDIQDQVSENEKADLERDNKKGHWNMSVGTSFSYMKGYGSGMSFYAAPTYTLPLSDRWSLHGGLIASSYTGLNSNPYNEHSLSNPSISSFALFVAASYRMSERLILHGTGVKQLANSAVPPLMAYPSDNLSFGATYMLGDNISIGATIQMNRGNGYYPGSPFQGSRYPSPFGW